MLIWSMCLSAFMDPTERKCLLYVTDGAVKSIAYTVYNV